MAFRGLTLIFLCASGLVVASSEPPRSRSGGREGALLPRPEVVRLAFAGYRNLAADYYWLRTINQVGSASNADEHLQIYRLADLTTRIDPKFREVYAFAGAMIPLHLGRERYVNTRESTLLLEHGAQVFPNDYRIRFQLGYNLVFFHQEYERAAKHFAELSKHPQAPRWMPSFAGRLYAQAGDFEASAALTTAMLEEAESEEDRAAWERRLLEIAQERIFRQVDAAAAVFKDREGRPPESLDELIARGDLSSRPEDPLGGRVYLDPNGRAFSTASPHRLEVIRNDDERDERVRRTEELKQNEPAQP